MADVFVSYAREDQARVAPLVDLLERQAWSVFWDRDIPPGETWRSHIGAALEQARCVVVAWTGHSILSDWVAEEADEARARDILVPVLLDPVSPPRGLRGVQAADLTGWPRQVDPHMSEAFLSAVARLVASGPPVSVADPSDLTEPAPIRLPAGTAGGPQPVLAAASFIRWGRWRIAVAAVAGAAVIGAAVVLNRPAPQSANGTAARSASPKGDLPSSYLETGSQVSAIGGSVGVDAIPGNDRVADPSKTKIIGISGKVIPLRQVVRELEIFR
jgi:hypothetical protein